MKIHISHGSRCFTAQLFGKKWGTFTKLPSSRLSLSTRFHIHHCHFLYLRVLISQHNKIMYLNPVVKIFEKRLKVYSFLLVLNINEFRRLLNYSLPFCQFI